MQNDPNKRHIPVEGHKGFYWKDSNQTEVGFRYRDSDNKRQYAYGSMRQFGGQPWNLRDAQKAYGRLNVSIERAEVVVSAKARTFRQVREEWLETRSIDGRTAEARDSNLRLYAGPFGRVKVRDTQEPQILKWLNGLRSARTGKALAEGSKEQILAAVSDVLRHAVKMKDIPVNPVNNLSKEDRPRQGEGRRRILSPEEEERLFL